MIQKSLSVATDNLVELEMTFEVFIYLFLVWLVRYIKQQESNANMKSNQHKYFLK